MCIQSPFYAPLNNRCFLHWHCSESNEQSTEYATISENATFVGFVTTCKTIAMFGLFLRQTIEKMSSSLISMSGLLRQLVTQLVDSQMKQDLWPPVYDLWLEGVLRDLDTIVFDTEYEHELYKKMNERRSSMTRSDYTRAALGMLIEFPSPVAKSDVGIKHMSFLKQLTRPIERADRQKLLLEVAEKLRQNLALEIT